MPNKHYNAQYNSFGKEGSDMKGSSKGFKNNSNNKKSGKTSPSFKPHTQDRDYSGSGKGHGYEKRKK